MSQINLHENDQVEISVCNGKLLIEKIDKPKYLNLKERLEAFYCQPIDKIFIENTQEIDTGALKGDEIW